VARGGPEAPKDCYLWSPRGLWFEKPLAKSGSAGIGKLDGVAHVSVKGAVGLW